MLSSRLKYTHRKVVKIFTSRKILHRDIKTANIFLALNPETGQEIVKLGDFGICFLHPRARSVCARACEGVSVFVSDYGAGCRTFYQVSL